MGTISVNEITFLKNGTQQQSRRTGQLIHNGPDSTLLINGGGRGSIKWYNNVGKGPYVVREHRYEIELKYGVQGHYTYQVLSKKRLVCRGRIKEKQASIPTFTHPLKNEIEPLLEAPPFSTCP